LGSRGRQISEFETSLVYRVSSRTARVTQKNPFSGKKKKETKNPQNNNNNKKTKQKKKKKPKQNKNPIPLKRIMKTVVTLA
jgi:hypothetical protein